MKRLSANFLLLLLASAVIAGTAQAQRHTVLVAWTASTDAASNPSLTYNIYRATSCSSTFAQLNLSAIAATTFTDASVFDGSTYCYQVTAVLTGTESVASSQATAVIPSASVPQSALTTANSSAASVARNSCTRHGTLANWLKCLASLPHAHK